ncbi:hypothetical protein KC332_g11408 [Hortaea werneckii]|nr:hypothetical protein KC358_g11441 [Hortaea werneckii]KAI6816538.1 hypothetical protein KC350_g10762 [Hortaea werneckii]KAI6919988.1 hypothetical protein KC348_g10494 [Hortaea werneckii]KAI6928641.1 hypothetical protein KC341_g11377 [Hortaea werneckii]KAI6963122.1 hypothetical protein KC321_g11396 [Hortaea werneckii]
MGHCLVLLAIQLYTWFLRLGPVGNDREILAVFLFVMVIFPCLLTGLFLFFDALPRYRQRQMSAIWAIFSMNLALSFQTYFLEPEGWPELIMWTAWAGYAGMLLGGICAFWEDGGQAQIENTQGPNTQELEKSKDVKQAE